MLLALWGSIGGAGIPGGTIPAFQTSAFQNDSTSSAHIKAFQIFYHPAIMQPPQLPGGGAGFVHFFSRRKWDELLEALYAEERALADIRGGRTLVQQQALQLATAAANRAIMVAREAAETAKLNAGLIRLANALDAAIAAKKVAYSIKRANAAIAASEAIIAEARKQGEEDEDMQAILLSAAGAKNVTYAIKRLNVAIGEEDEEDMITILSMLH